MIEARGISYSAGSCVILNDVSVAIKPGQITAILGPNGAGKSTLLKCLTAFHQPNNGTVCLEGKPLEDYSLDSLSRKRAVLSQSGHIGFPFTGFEIAMMGRNPYVSKGNPGCRGCKGSTRKCRCMASQRPYFPNALRGRAAAHPTRTCSGTVVGTGKRLSVS